MSIRTYWHPQGVSIRTYWHPQGVSIRTYWHPPPINFLDDAVLFHCSTAAGSCYPLQIQCMANRRAPSGGECRSTSSLPTFLASSRPSLARHHRTDTVQVHCRAAFTLSSRLPLFVYTLQLSVLYVAGGDTMLNGEDEGETNTNSLVVQ